MLSVAARAGAGSVRQHVCENLNAPSRARVEWHLRMQCCQIRPCSIEKHSVTYIYLLADVRLAGHGLAPHLDPDYLGIVQRPSGDVDRSGNSRVIRGSVYESERRSLSGRRIHNQRELL